MIEKNRLKLFQAMQSFIRREDHNARADEVLE